MDQKSEWVNFILYNQGKFTGWERIKSGVPPRVQWALPGAAGWGSTRIEFDNAIKIDQLPVNLQEKRPASEVITGHGAQKMLLKINRLISYLHPIGKKQTQHRLQFLYTTKSYLKHNRAITDDRKDKLEKLFKKTFKLN